MVPNSFRWNRLSSEWLGWRSVPLKLRTWFLASSESNNGPQWVSSSITNEQKTDCEVDKWTGAGFTALQTLTQSVVVKREL